MKFEIIFQDYLTDEHVDAVRTMLHRLDGVEVIEDNKDSIVISTNEAMEKVIKDMSVCDYLTACSCSVG